MPTEPSKIDEKAEDKKMQTSASSGATGAKSPITSISDPGVTGATGTTSITSISGVTGATGATGAHVGKKEEHIAKYKDGDNYDEFKGQGGAYTIDKDGRRVKVKE